MEAVVVDALGAGRGRRFATVDVIGAGPRAVAGVLEKHNLNVRVYPAHVVLSRPELLAKASILLVSAMTVDLPTARKVKSIWDRHSGGVAVIGGPIAADPYDALIRAGFSISVIGEGEETLDELLPLIMAGELSPEKLSEIKGLAYLDSSGVRVNSLRPVMSRIKLSSYKPSISAVKGYPNYYACRVYVEVVRGCSNYYRTSMPLPDGRRCIDCGLCREGSLEERYYCPQNIPPGCGYCSVPSLFGPSRSRSIESIVEEVRGLIKVGVKRLILSGSDFLDYGRDMLVEPKPLTDPREPPPNLNEIEHLLSEISSVIKESGERVFVGIENVKPCLVTDEVARILGRYLKDSPVHIGCETGSAEHSYALGRPSSPEEALKAARILKRFGLRPCLYFIHGLPGQTIETAKATVGFIEKSAAIGVEKITVYRFQPLPMSAFGDFPRAPPAHRDPVSFMIWSAANKVNSQLKLKLVGRVVEAIVVRSQFKGMRFIAYPFRHGPVIRIKNERMAEGLVGRIVKIRIVRVVSERAVEGLIVD